MAAVWLPSLNNSEPSEFEIAQQFERETQLFTRAIHQPRRKEPIVSIAANEGGHRAVNAAAPKNINSTHELRSAAANVNAGPQLICVAVSAKKAPAQVANFCRWCARPIHGTRTMIASLFCSAACAQSLAYVAVRDRGYVSDHYERASMKAKRIAVSGPRTGAAA